MTKTSAILPALLFASALAQAQSEPAPPSFQELDQDRDGQISVTEAEADIVVLRRFSEADRNQDGYLTQEEYAVVVTTPGE